MMLRELSRLAIVCAFFSGNSLISAQPRNLSDLSQSQLEAWHEFNHLYSVSKFGKNAQAKEAAVKKLSQLENFKAWELFEEGTLLLQDGANRKDVAEIFHRIVKDYPNSRYSRIAAELADLLNAMHAEDEKFTVSSSDRKLSEEELLSHYIFKLRDCQCDLYSRPSTHELVLFRFPVPENNNPYAVKIMKVGKSAVPLMKDLLKDRRPIRGVTFWKHFAPTRTVLRYQDVAFQILCRIQGVDPFKLLKPHEVFSEQSIERQDELVSQLFLDADPHESELNVDKNKSKGR